MAEDKPYLWILDSDRTPLAESLEAFDAWADIFYAAPGSAEPDWSRPPAAVFFSAEIAGGANGEPFVALRRLAENAPLLAVARLRSLTQAVSFFRAGVDDYLSLPLEEDEVRERLEAALEKAAARAMEGLVVELEAVDGDPGDVSLSLRPSAGEPGGSFEDDIIAGLDGTAVAAPPETDRSAADVLPDDEPTPVDGLPIPTLWEELPCGLLVFDSAGNLVFSNSLGLELFGQNSLAELEDALESRRSLFAAHGANHKPLADNQWPQVLALKTRTARSAVVSIEKPDRRRVWLRIDCLPHVAEGRINRLSMTLVNLTGELPPLIVPREGGVPPPGKREKAKPRSKRRK